MNDGILRNLIRIGTVSSVNEINGTVRVIFEDKDNMVSDELPLLSSEYNLPKIKDQVLCLFLPNGVEAGFCLGSFYSLVNPPPVKNKDLFYKKFDDGTWIQYNKTTKELNIGSAGAINIIGDVNVQGNLHVTGAINGN
ncbi:phage baseplate assembly protein V [Clostridium chromiireducens]|uniref:Phage-related baseplate assembly protein n=1 Tax=Clostridium chromiireducens TaxID=225345 RepID=A0A1V4IV34_9CLOT|nr:phage baseplate assembly protein V [Clostridium chromiireducens]OPJ63680.1 phage-related baseplate assembly protein [Clostridium chromiireducens]